MLIDPETGTVERIIALQYPSESLSRSLEIQAIADEPDRSQPLRLTGPAVETITLEAELDATDQLEFPDQNGPVVDAGLFPVLSAIESLVYPTTAQLTRQDEQAGAGSFEITPVETPLALFVWSRNRIAPVRVTSLSITEDFFDPQLNPIHATVSLTLRVLSVDDLGFRHRGGGLFMAYLRAKEQLASQAQGGELASFGISEAAFS